MWKNPEKLKRILAWAGVVILVLLYLVTFILGVTGTAETRDLLMAAVMCTVIVPVLMYGMLLVAKVLSGHKEPPVAPEDEKKKKQKNQGKS